MFGYIWPVLLIVFSNVIYQVCTKGVPGNVNPFASLMVTYVVGAVTSAVIYFLTNSCRDFAGEIAKLTWHSYVLGIFIVGLEAGFIYAYKAGWQVSVTSIVQSSALTVLLIFVGVLIYGETLTLNKIIGILICIVGLIVINIK